MVFIIGTFKTAKLIYIIGPVLIKMAIMEEQYEIDIALIRIYNVEQLLYIYIYIFVSNFTLSLIL